MALFITATTTHLFLRRVRLCKYQVWTDTSTVRARAFITIVPEGLYGTSKYVLITVFQRAMVQVLVLAPSTMYGTSVPYLVPRTATRRRKYSPNPKQTGKHFPQVSCSVKSRLVRAAIANKWTETYVNGISNASCFLLAATTKAMDASTLYEYIYLLLLYSKL